jgi:hypothetical protein
VYELVLRHKLMTKAALDEVLRAEVLTQPRAMPVRTGAPVRTRAAVRKSRAKGAKTATRKAAKKTS